MSLEYPHSCGTGGYIKGLTPLKELINTIKIKHLAPDRETRQKSRVRCDRMGKGIRSGSGMPNPITRFPRHTDFIQRKKGSYSHISARNRRLPSDPTPGKAQVLKDSLETVAGLDLCPVCWKHLTKTAVSCRTP